MHQNTNLKRRFALVPAVAITVMLFASATPAQILSGAGANRQDRSSLKPSERQEEFAALFAPSFRYQDISVRETTDRRIVVAIMPDEKLNPKKIRRFTDALISRSISVYGAPYFGDFSWTKTADNAAVTMTRKHPAEPDTVEVTVSSIMDPESGLPVVPLTVSSSGVYIALSEDFGKKWRAVALSPGREPASPELKAGKYPGARLREFRDEDGKRRRFIYAAKGNLTEVERFYVTKLSETHKTVIKDGDADAPPAPAEVFGIKTSAQVVTLTGYTYAAQKLHSTAVTLRKTADPVFSDYIEIEVTEN